MATAHLPSRLRTPACVMLGSVFVSLAALTALSAARIPLVHFLIRHARGDWGQITDEDWQRNEYALATGDHLLSSYVLSTGQKIWIQTAGDRAVTFVLLPVEQMNLPRFWGEALRT
ncbi:MULTISPECIES: hypothetical protein [Cupriavidus]|uniref:hypothetical protein n=1 Tax=Cupriavidus TaxID=106589 RepID=UPI0025A7FB4D|nr:hypothetical protein [Cupriavidus sp. TKC]GMG91439.1 hypothetical protein Cmtc_26590 [Cupriavidus sp. TKC]